MHQKVNRKRMEDITFCLGEKVNCLLILIEEYSYLTVLLKNRGTFLTYPKRQVMTDSKTNPIV